MADVDITVGLSLQELVETTKEAKEHVEALADGFRSLAEIAGISLTVAGIKEFVTSMAELGNKAETISALLGITSEQFVQLSGIARLGGQDISSMATGLERMTLNMQRSTRDAFNPAAEALRMLGINARQFTEMNAAAQFEALTNAVQRFNPSMNLTNALMLIGGRGVANLVATLRSAGANWDEWNAKVKESSVGLADAVPLMADTHVKLGLLETAAQSFGARLFTVLKPAIDLVVTAMTNFFNSLTIDKIARFADQAIQDISLFGAAVITWSGAAKEEWDKFVNDLKGFFSVSVTIDEGSLADKAIKFLSGIAEALRKWNSETWPEMVGTKEKLQQFGGEAFGPPAPTVLDKWTAFWEQLRDKMTDGLRTLGMGGDAGLGKEFGAIPFGAQNAMREALVAIDQGYKEIEAKAREAVAAFQMTEYQKDELLKQALLNRHIAEVEAGESAVKSEAKYAADLAKINEQETKSIVDSWKKAADGIANAFNSQLRGLLAGTTSLADAMKNIFADLVVSLISYFVKMAAEWVAAQLAMMVAGRTTLGARVAAFSSTIMSDASLAWAGTFANASPELGLAAAGPASEAYALVMAQLAGAPKLAVGTDYVPRDMFAYLHQGERVVPAAQNTSNYGGSNVSLNINAIDAKSIAQMFMSNKNVMNTVLTEIARINPGAVSRLAAGGGL